MLLRVHRSLLLLTLSAALCLLFGPATNEASAGPKVSCSGANCSPGASGCEGCDIGQTGSCGACITGCSCICNCDSASIGSRDTLFSGLALSTVYDWNNTDATLSNVLGVFVGYYNWDVTFANGDDPTLMTVGNTDFIGVSGTSLLASMSSTFDLCYEVDAVNYEITFDDAGECS